MSVRIKASYTDKAELVGVIWRLSLMLRNVSDILKEQKILMPRSAATQRGENRNNPIHTRYRATLIITFI